MTEHSVEGEVQEGECSPFYRQLIKRHEELFPGETNSKFLAICRLRKDYGKNVETYRINIVNGSFLLNEEKNIVEIPVNILENDIPSPQKSMKKGMTKIFATTIKSKGHLVKLLSDVPLPSIFVATLLITLLCTITASTTAIVKYTADRTLFDNIGAKMNAIRVQSESISDLLEISTVVLDAVGYNEYFP